MCGRYQRRSDKQRIAEAFQSYIGLEDLYLDAEDEISPGSQSAGKCYSYGESTACVFHLMRVIDSGLRLVYASLGETYDARNWEGIAKKIESEMNQKHQDKSDSWR